jgi:hypothetical protein
MMRQTAVDMENSEYLLDANNTLTRKCKPYYLCCLLISHAIVYGLGFYSGYLYSENRDGSN